MRQIKFREWLGKEFHYWGFLRDGAFIGPSDPKGIHNQFTGLLDNNGKEIWEGDIISFLGYYDYKVVFEDAKFVCYHITHPEIGKWGDLSIMMDPDFAKDEFKVIGNIYENPDLLK